MKLFKRFSFYAKSKFAFTVIPTIEIMFERTESESFFFDFELSIFLWYCGFSINPEI